MPTLEHVHSYVRMRGKWMGKDSYKCDDPMCTSVAPRDLIKGKVTLCPKCKETQFLLTSKHLRMARPVCKLCSKNKEGREFRALQDRINRVLNLRSEEEMKQNAD